MKRLGVLLSGRGSNFLAIHQAIADDRLPQTEIAVVLSNKADAPGLAAARDLGLPAHHIPIAGRTPAQRDQEFIARLREASVDLVCLAGYMRIVTPAFVQAFPNRILNVHPSLLPSFPGLEAQAQALEFGARIAGCTVHFVDEAVDHRKPSPPASSSRSTRLTPKPSPRSSAKPTMSRAAATSQSSSRRTSQ
jgi:phosphoribosylglycinamide formyltransferase-1